MENLKSKTISAIVAIFVMLFSFNSKGQMSCPYTITNLTAFDIKVHYEVLDTPPGCATKCTGVGVIITQGNAITVGCCGDDVYVGVSDYYDTTLSAWTSITTLQASSTHAGGGCGYTPNTLDGGNIDGSTPFTITWGISDTQIQ